MESRLNYLDSMIDYFVLIESNVTFSGKQKPLYFLENQLRFSSYKHKIIYYPFIFDNSIHQLDFFKFDKELLHNMTASPWQVEYMQRNHITKALDLFDDNPFVIMGDVDEIPSLHAIDFARKNPIPVDNTLVVFQTQMFYYNLNTMHPNTWPSTIFTTKEVIQKNTPQILRDRRWASYGLPTVMNAGWHLSYFGDVQQIQYKVDSFAHQELNIPSIVNEKNIETSVNESKCFFDGNQFVNVDLSIFPQDFLKHFEKFAKKDV